MDKTIYVEYLGNIYEVAEELDNHLILYATNDGREIIINKDKDEFYYLTDDDISRSTDFYEDLLMEQQEQM